jgi:hypothetical protein
VKTFAEFPPTAVCPICETSEPGECFLMPIDGTEDEAGRICQAAPTHVSCGFGPIDRLRYNREHGVVYLRTGGAE